MVATFLLPPPRPPDNSGGAPLPTIPEGQAYSDNSPNHSALQGGLLAGKISQNGCHMMIGQELKISKNGLNTTTPPRKTTNVSQDMRSVVSHMQRMVSDQAELLEKIFHHQEKQSRRAQRAARKARKAADEARSLQLCMLSIMQTMAKSCSTGRHTKSSLQKSSKSNNSNAIPFVTPTNNRDIDNAFSTDGHSNSYSDNSKISTSHTMALISARKPNKKLPNDNNSDRKDDSASSQYEVSECNKNGPPKCAFIKNDSLLNSNSEYPSMQDHENGDLSMRNNDTDNNQIGSPPTGNFSTNHHSKSNDQNEWSNANSSSDVTQNHYHNHDEPLECKSDKDNPSTGNHNHDIIQQAIERQLPQQTERNHPNEYSKAKPSIGNHITATKYNSNDFSSSNHITNQSKRTTTSNPSTRQPSQSHVQHHLNGKLSVGIHSNKEPQQRKGNDKYTNLFPDHPS
jgi:hypothetical protein